MTDLYQTLCVVRTSIANSIGESLITGETIPTNYVRLMSVVADEVNTHFDFMGGVEEFTFDELEDLGFQYISIDSDLMLFPLWLYTFIPDGTELRNTKGGLIIKGEDDVAIYSENWINMGIMVD